MVTSSYSGSSSVPTGYFSIVFLGGVESEYSSNTSFRSTDQEGILTSHAYYGRRNEVEQSLLDNSDYRIFPENPLKMGFYLENIIPGKFSSY